MMFWSSSSAPAAQPSAPAVVPRVHVFSTSHAHVHHAEKFMEVMEEVMERPAAEFKLSLMSIEDQSADTVLVSVASVVHMARLMASFASLQTTHATPDATPVVLAYEVGKAEHALRPGDKIVVLTSHAAVHSALGDRVTCIDLARHHERIYTRDRQLR